MIFGNKSFWFNMHMPIDLLYKNLPASRKTTVLRDMSRYRICLVTINSNNTSPSIGTFAGRDQRERNITTRTGVPTAN